MHILVIGNCQQAPIASILRTSGLSAETAPRAIHLLTDDDLPELQVRLDRADVVVLQVNTRPRFVAMGLDPSSLRARHPRVLVVPNLYVAAWAPSFTAPWPDQAEPPAGLQDLIAQNRLGPCIDLLAWRALEVGLPLSDLTRWLRRADLARIPELAEAPLDELRRREARCDVAISDWIADQRGRQRLFYSLNHPTNALLAELVQRILLALDVPHALVCRRTPYLSNVRLPVYPAVAALWGVADDPACPTGGGPDDHAMHIRVDDPMAHLATSARWFEQRLRAGDLADIGCYRDRPAWHWAGRLVEQAQAD